ncbi:MULTISPECIES: cytoskeleton protein RodZ [unclassified Photobacterium]|uniref:cytoskeleton protein RodZ n=1 Tax=unclassified Photobacterium TaxID=2628852 RepID=UPI001EDCDD9D|nr:MULTISPECIES: cytoskeleton protein RodZ [unclassified Photobacterium]MCG3863201.1 cytoskeleton protein RodZ [Photobacterium sp. Ph6]MCG3874731.1 cytoskeleton protein RodZ [Photobacterium sp. Ph5]
MNTENNEEQKITEGTQLPGDVLRQAREQLGYSQKDIANRLRLRISVIDNIENNRFDQAQLATFTRGYVRSYAKYVGLEEEAVLGLLDKCGHTKPKAQEMQSFSRRTKREAHDSRIMGLTWILAAVFVGVTAVWWWQNIHLEQAPVAVTTAEQTVAHKKQEQGSDATIVTTLNGDDASISATQPATVDTNVDHSASTSTEQNTAASTTSADAATDSSPTTTSTAATGTTVETSTTPAGNTETASTSVSTATDATANAETTANATPVVDATAPQLQLKFSADCWIDVRDATGKRLESGIKKAGQVLDLEGKAPFRVRLGAPSAVKINIKGQPFDLSRYPASKPVTLKLPQ